MNKKPDHRDFLILFLFVMLAIMVLLHGGAVLKYNALVDLYAQTINATYSAPQFTTNITGVFV